MAPAVTTPPALILAIAGLLLVHTPLGVVLDSVLLAVIHALNVPVIAAGEGFTVRTAMLVQPVDASVNVMFVVPAPTPVTTPSPLPISAIVALPELHVPVPDVLVSVVVSRGHTLRLPPIAAGAAFTVATVYTLQPVEVSVKVIVAVPALTPLTMPLDNPTDAILALLLVQVPAPDTLVSAIVAPGHIAPVLPPIGSGVVVLYTALPSVPQHPSDVLALK